MGLQEQYQELLKRQKAKITEEQNRYYQLELQLRHAYRLAIVRKYMAIWQAGKFPLDDELTDAIFHLAGMEVDVIPKTELSLDKQDNRLHFKYYNKRLSQWIELEP